MQKVDEHERTYDNPIRIIQFGEGNFLRAFWGKAVHELNKSGDYAGQICVVQPIPNGRVQDLAEQNYLYTVMLQGPSHEEITCVESIKTGVNPYQDYDTFLSYAVIPSLRIMISNTTEAGIVFDADDTIDARPPSTYPGKLLAFLYKRFKKFKGSPGTGLLHFPCELIENNGRTLKHTLIKLASALKLEKAFVDWVEQENVFFNTLVDCIVTGYPHGEADEIFKRLGYTDPLLVKAESYQLLVIEGDGKYRKEFPINRAGMNVVWTDNLDYYREIKVRIMNGFQTMLAHSGFLAGIRTEREALNHQILGTYLQKGLFNYIVPSLPYAVKETVEFAHTVLKRLNNPNIEHILQDINLNSFTKFQTRLQPSLEFWAEKGEYPDFMLFSLALVLSLYQIDGFDGNNFTASCCGRKYSVYDTPEKLKLLFRYKQQEKQKNWDTRIYLQSLLEDNRLWRKQLDLPETALERTAELFRMIEQQGILETVRKLDVD